MDQFDQLVDNVVQNMIFKEEMKYLDGWGCKRINHTLCSLLQTYWKEVHSHPTLDEFVAYHYHSCQSTCEYSIPIEDAIPLLMYSVIEYGRILNCKSLYIFHMSTHSKNRYPTETEFIEENQDKVYQLIPYILSNTIPNQLCCICQEELLSEQCVITLPCIHTFHTENNECRGINNWLLQSPECPLCKQKIEI